MKEYGPPPNKPVTWKIVTKSGVKMTSRGQTAFHAVQAAGLTFQDIQDMKPILEEA